MAGVTDWSKFQREQLYTLLEIQNEAGKGNIASLDRAIKALKARMEKEDIGRVLEEMQSE